MKKRAVWFVLVALAVAPLALGGTSWAVGVDSIEFSPPEYKFGVVDQDEIVRTEVAAYNRGDRSVELSLIPTCDCLTVTPTSATIPPSGKASFALTFDPKDYEGKTQRFFIVKTDIPGAKPHYFILSGMVRPANARIDAAAAQGSAGGAAWTGLGAAAGVVKLSYYYMPGCRSCEKFLKVDLPEMEARVGAAVEIERKDLLNDATYEELTAFASSIGTTVRTIPALRIGNVLLQGDREIADRLPGLLTVSQPGAAAATAPAAWTAAPPPVGPAKSSAFDIAILPVIAAGLVDGINPCAFTTLIFLLASLALAGRGRREVLAIGAFFSAGVFLAYMGAGFGLFAALRAAQGVAVVAAIIRWVLVAILVGLAGVSVYDYTRIRIGRSSEMLLQLPNSLKLKIHESIRNRRRTSTLAVSSFALGVLVSIFEFACTAQVYLPTLAYLARSQKRADAILLLVLYNVCFIAPLLAVFAASYCGVSSKRLAELFQRRVGWVKMLLAAVFLVLAALTILA